MFYVTTAVKNTTSHKHISTSGVVFSLFCVFSLLLCVIRWAAPPGRCIAPRQHEVAPSPTLQVKAFTSVCLTPSESVAHMYAKLLRWPRRGAVVPSHQELCGVQKVTSGLWGLPLRWRLLQETVLVSSPPSFSNCVHVETPGTPGAPARAKHTCKWAETVVLGTKSEKKWLLWEFISYLHRIIRPIRQVVNPAVGLWWFNVGSQKSRSYKLTASTQDKWTCNLWLEDVSSFIQKLLYF